MFRVVENTRQRHLDWVQQIMEAKHWSENRLAKEAGLSASGINRFLNDPDNKRQLRSSTIERLEAASGIPLPRAQSFRELPQITHELEPIDRDAIPQQPARAANGIEAWKIRTRALELAGYIPGDMVIVDRTARPMDGDVVVAQVGGRNGEPETVMRIYETSFLLAATMDPAHLSPIFINKDVSIVGVVISSHRERRAA